MDKKMGVMEVLMGQGVLQKDDEHESMEREKHEAMIKKMEAEDAARALIKAEEIRSNRDLFKSAKAELKRMSQAAKKAGR